MEQFHGTTILSVRRGNSVALGGDGQVTLGNIVVKGSARKVRRIFHDRILAGFAGGTADAFTLFERFEAKLEKHQGHLLRSAVELAKDWRTDRMLRRLEAMLVVCDAQSSLIISGNGDVLEPEQGLVAIGSGGPYAQAAARALLDHIPAEIEHYESAALWKALRDFQPDIVHTHMAKAGLLGRFAVRAYNIGRGRARARVVHTYHGHVLDGYFSPLKTSLFINLEQPVGGSAPVVIRNQSTGAEQRVEAAFSGQQTRINIYIPRPQLGLGRHAVIIGGTPYPFEVR